MPDLEVLRSKKQVASEKLKALEASLKTVTEIDSIEIGSATERQRELSLDCGSVWTDGAVEVAKCYEACSRKFDRFSKDEEV